MNQINNLETSPLGQSLIELRQLRKSATASIVLMLLGIAIVLSTLIYSASMLRPLERQVTEKQTQLLAKQSELSDLEHRSQQTRLDLANIERELTTRKKELADAETRLNAAKKLLASAPQEQLQSLAAANPRAAQLLPRVYIHVADESQRKSARRLQSDLEEAGFLVPGIENVGRKHLSIPRLTEVRFGDARDSRFADELGKRIQRAFGIQVRTRKLSGNRYPLARGTFEIWFGRVELRQQ